MGIRVGVGVGPVRASAGVSNKGAADAFVWMMIFGGVVLLVIWPYLLGTYVAVAGFGAGLTSSARNVTGWVFEATYLLTLLGAFIAAVCKDVRRR